MGAETVNGPFPLRVSTDLMPLYLLTLFVKNEKANINKAERNALAGLVELLVQIWLES